MLEIIAPTMISNQTDTFRRSFKFKMNDLLIPSAKKVRRLGFSPVPITAGAEKKPPAWFSWTDLRDERRPALTEQEIESIFSNQRLAESD